MHADDVDQLLVVCSTHMRRHLAFDDDAYVRTIHLR